MRKIYIDNIRWITGALVVIYHVFYIFNAAGQAGGIGPLEPVQYQDAVLYILYPWFMLLLFVVSGMSARFYLSTHTNKEFLKAKTTKLLVPSTIGTLVFWWILGYLNMKMGGAFEAMGSLPGPVLYLIMCTSGIGPLWYIQVLWLFSVILIVLRNICPRAVKQGLKNLCEKTNVPVLILLGIGIWGAAQIGNVPIITVYRFGIYGLGFLLGYAVFWCDEVMERLEKWWLPLSIAAVVLGIAFAVSFWGKPYADHEVLDTLLCNVYAWIAVLAVFSFMKKWGNAQNSFSKWMTGKSWGLYLFHYLPLAAYAILIYNCNVPIWIKYAGAVVSSFTGGLLLYELIRRIPVLRWCVCGIKKK